MKSDEKSI